VQRRPAAGRRAGGTRGGRREQGVGRTEGQAHRRTGWGAEGGVCGGKCVRFPANRAKGGRPEKSLDSCILDSQRSDSGKNQAGEGSVWRDSRFFSTENPILIGTKQALDLLVGSWTRTTTTHKSQAFSLLRGAFHEVTFFSGYPELSTCDV
jgi:hypothetical protein